MLYFALIVTSIYLHKPASAASMDIYRIFRDICQCEAQAELLIFRQYSGEILRLADHGDKPIFNTIVKVWPMIEEIILYIISGIPMQKVKRVFKII